MRITANLELKPWIFNAYLIYTCRCRCHHNSQSPTLDINFLIFKRKVFLMAHSFVWNSKKIFLENLIHRLKKWFLFPDICSFLFVKIPYLKILEYIVYTVIDNNVNMKGWKGLLSFIVIKSPLARAYSNKLKQHMIKLTRQDISKHWALKLNKILSWLFRVTNSHTLVLATITHLNFN